ncbi:hypothetical protein FBU59_002654 [Linderina macrospora]|uniref:Uncharacterized protein n=1 Tax=Linderina macrospora TaxID=4868 RepID=A0ACC1JAK5_9FUNG|nr:hypothetical protein FBU59_002654 [Linderina macrospora]
MPPVDILREYYAASLAVEGIVQVPQLINIRVEKLMAAGPKGQKGQVKITAITIRESHTDLVPMPAPHGHRAHHHGHNKVHHHGHPKIHLHHDHDHGQVPVPDTPNALAEYARFEVLCLVASLVLSMVLLYIGYKIGGRIYNYENARSQNGRGHRHARIHREVIWSSVDEKRGLLDNDAEDSDGDGGDVEEEAAIESQPVLLAAPQVARTRE